MNTIDITDDNLHTFYSKISQNIIKIRKVKNISIRFSNINWSYICNFFGKAELLAENKHFNLEHLYKIAIALNVDIKEFFEGIETTY